VVKELECPRPTAARGHRLERPLRRVAEAAHLCKAAGLPHFHPHDLRHRYASVKLREGVPVTDLAAQLGHSKKSMTLDVYSHVLLDN
jgi:integrase